MKGRDGDGDGECGQEREGVLPVAAPVFHSVGTSLPLFLQ